MRSLCKNFISTDTRQNKQKTRTKDIAATLLRRMMTLLLTITVGSMTNMAWAADIKYHIINNQGKECFVYVIKDGFTYSSIDKTTLCVHPHARSIFATNFRFYTTLDEAIKDANGTVGGFFSEGRDIVTDPEAENYTGSGPFYVRYDMVENPAIDITGTMSYLMQIRERNNNKGTGRRRQVYYDNGKDSRFEFGYPGNKEEDIPDDDLDKDLQYRFRFVANGDPYNIYIYNGTAENANPNGVMTLPNIGSSVKEIQKITYTDKISNYDPNTTTNLQTFFLVAPDDNTMDIDWKTHWADKYFIVGAYGGIECWMRDKGSYTVNSNDEANMPYMLCAMGSTGSFSDPGYQLQAFRSWRNDDPRISNTALVKLTQNEPTHEVTYHIVNSANPTNDVLTIVQHHGPSSKYNLSNRAKLQRLGCTLSTDYYSDSDCAEGHKLAANATVGDATDVYIPYTFDAAGTTTATNLVFSTEKNPVWFSMDIRESGTRLLTYDATNNVIDSRYGPKDATRILQESQYAFIGDPYSFRVICKGADGKYAYVDPETINIFGANVADNVRFTESPTDDRDCWAMVAGTTTNSFQIFQRDAYAFQYRSFWDARGGGNEIRMWAQSSGNEIAASSNLHVTPIPTYNYIYNIVDNKGRVAIKYTVTQEVNHRLNGDHGHKAIPSAIYSPYIEGETLTFYTFTGEFNAANLTDANKINSTPNSGANIYVRYTNDKLSTRRYLLDGTKSYFMQLGDKYVIYNSGVTTQAGRPIIEGEGSEGKELKIWTLRNSDPYDVEVQNTGEGNHKLLDDTEIHFILMDGAGTAEGQVELLFANGADLSTPSNSQSLDLNGENVRKYTTTRGTTNQQIIFHEAVLERTYRLLDKQGKILLEYEGRELPNSGKNLGVLAKWVSPLVETYHYWARSSFTLSGDTYTLKSGESEITSPTGSTDGYIYVTYDTKVNNNIITVVDPTKRDHRDGDASQIFVRKASDFGQMFMIKFDAGESFYQERGDSLREETMKAVYPYSNGDSGFNLYGDAKWDEDRVSASTTRTRWS